MYGRDLALIEQTKENKACVNIKTSDGREKTTAKPAWQNTDWFTQGHRRDKR